LTNPWVSHHHEVGYACPWFEVVEHEVTLPNGSPGRYHVVEIPPSVGIVASNSSGEIAMIYTWRFPTQRRSLEIPSGRVELHETLLQAAQRELAEEARLTSTEWTPSIHVDASNGLTTDQTTIFFAEACETLTSDETSQVDPDEYIDERVWLSLNDAIELATSGGITQGISLVGIFLASQRRMRSATTAPPHGAA
jgi:8-oxo-dGTP pyrophosphatase MutT (NUDIX family)